MKKLKTTLYMFLLAALVLTGNVQAQEHTGEGNAKSGLMAKVGFRLATLYSQHRLSSLQGAEFALNSPAIPASGDSVVIEAVASGDAGALQADLEKLGLKNAASAGRMVSGLLPITAIPDVAALDSLQFARPAYAVLGVGDATTQGDAALRSDEARAAFGVDGGDTKVGVLSDSADCRGGLVGDILSGDLPTSVFVIQEEPECISGTDEGRAVMQVVHDVAPGASLWFHTALSTQAHLVNAINALAAIPDMRIIVDDIIYLAEPMFQDGMVAQAVDEVVGKGVAYFSSAGNSGRDSYESPFVAGQEFDDAGDFPGSSPPFLGGTAHDFDPDPDNVDIFQRIRVGEGSRLLISFQWDAPFKSLGDPQGPQNELDIYILNEAETEADMEVLGGSSDPNFAGDPVEIVDFLNPEGSGEEFFNIMITHRQGEAPERMKYVLFELSGDTEIMDYPTFSSTLFGHANAEGAMAVGAAFYAETPEFGISPPLIEPFSSAGPTPILFDTSGNRLGTPIIRDKPEIVAPDGGNTTFLGNPDPSPGGPFEADGFPNFFGTSASAAHAAGVAALLLDADPFLVPDSVYSILEGTAIDMDDPDTEGFFDTGFDFRTGHGFIQAYHAVLATLSTDLELLAKSDSADPVRVGEELTFTLAVTNNGPATSTAATLTDTLPSGYSFVSATSTSGSISSEPEPGESGPVTFDLGDLSVGQSATTTIVVIPTEAGTFTNRARVDSVQPDPDPDNNEASEDTTVTGVPDLAVTKTDSSDPVTVGDSLTYTIVVSNIGSATSTGVVLTDTLPAGVGFVSATSTSASISSEPEPGESGPVIFDLGDLSVGQTATTTIVVIPSTAGTITNTASVTSEDEDLDDTNDSASEDTQVDTETQSPPPDSGDNGDSSSSSSSGSRGRPRSADTPTPVPTPAPTATPTPQDETPPPSPPTPVPSDVVEDAPLEEAVQIVEDVPLDEAVDIIRAISLEKKVAILSEMDADKAAAIMEELPLDDLVEIVNAMEMEELIDILPRMSPESVFQIPAEVLFANLPGVPVEQLVGEVPPTPHPDLGRPTSTQDSPTKTTYLVPETREDAWVIMIGSPAPLDLVLGKFTRELNSIRVIVEDLTEPPPTVPKFPPDVVLDSMFTIDLPDSEVEDISVAHVTLYVEKDWVEDNNIHKWSIQFNRLDEEIGAWVPHPSKRIREDEERIFYSVGIPGFSVFAVTGSPDLPEQIFQVTDLQISPEAPTAGQQVSITASVTNTSSERAVYPASLWIDSTIEDSQHILVEAGQTEPVSFTVSRPVGAYDVRIDRLLGDFVVFPEIKPELVQEPEPTPVSVILAASPTVTSAVVPTPTSTAVPMPRPTITPTPAPSPSATPLVAASLASTPVPPTPTATPITLEAALPQPTQENGTRNIMIAVAIVVAVGILAAGGIVGLYGYSIRSDDYPE